MKRGIVIVALLVVAAMACEVFTRVMPSTIEYRGQQIKLTRFYFDYDQYKNDPDNIHPSETARVQELVRRSPVSKAYPNWQAAVSGVHDIVFPGYGSGSLKSEWQTLRAMSIEVPRAEQDRIFVFHISPTSCELFDEFLAPAELGVAEVQEKDGALIFLNYKGERVLERRP